MADVEKISVGGTAYDICDATARASIPTKTSQLQNDSGFTTFSGNYNDLSNKPTIPTKTSQLQNDSGFITSSSLPNTNYSQSSGWGRQIIGNAAIVATMTASQSVVFDQGYGSEYWRDVTFNIPQEVRLNSVINAQVTALAGSGLINCNITYLSTSAITIRVSNPQVATIDVRFNITMFGGV